jgi:hypothetical protein
MPPVPPVLLQAQPLPPQEVKPLMLWQAAWQDVSV